MCLLFFQFPVNYIHKIIQRNTNGSLSILKYVVDPLFAFLIFQLGPDTAHLVGIERDEFRIAAAGEYGDPIAVLTGGVRPQGQTLAVVSEYFDDAAVDEYA